MAIIEIPEDKIIGKDEDCYPRPKVVTSTTTQVLALDIYHILKDWIDSGKLQPL